MHPCIAAFPNVQYYHGLLEFFTVPSSPPRGYAWPTSSPVVFEHIAGAEVLQGTSWDNPLEALRVVEIVHDLSRAGDVSPEDILILTPYQAQIVYLKSVLASRGMDECGVQSVDQAEGSEKEVIVISTMRCNSQGRLGFLNDLSLIHI